MTYFLALIFLFISSAQADLLVRPRTELISLGFKSVKSQQKFIKISGAIDTHIYEDHSLEWPIKLERDDNQFIGNMHQYQTFTDPPYYHAGVDILANKDQLITAPVSGIIEAGYYSYTDDYYGNTEKFFLPLKEALKDDVELPWGKAYFELAIVDDRGHRFEFHHADPDDIPTDIFARIMSENPEHKRVEAGIIIGKVYDWDIRRGKIPTRHIHYNIVHHEGHHLNPFNFSSFVDDPTPPVITDVYAAKKSFCHKAPELIKFDKETPLQTNDYIVVRALDIFRKGVFSKAPVIIHARFEDGTEFIRDFSRKIVDDFGKRPHIREVYLVSQCMPKLRTEMRASRSSDFYFKVPVDPYYNGRVEITVYDQNMNSHSKVVNLIGKGI